jgi:tetratricopeptide (TPR) repeat protein
MCREIGARFLLGGTVRRDASSAKISSWLIDTADGRQVWTKAFKRSLEAADLIETQEEIAASVVAALGSEHGVIAQRLAAESRKKRPSDLSTYEAMLRYHAYQIAPSPSASEPCFEALEAAVKREPEYGPAWSALATLYCQMYVFDAPGFEDPLAMGLSYAQRGASLEPGRQLSRLILAYASLLGDALGTFESEASTTLSLNPNNPYATGAIGYMHVLAGNFDHGRELLDRAMAASPIQPRWFGHGYYLVKFREGDYQGAFDALNHADKTEPWQPLLVAAALGKLGRTEEAVEPIAALLARKPDFPMRARELLERTIKSTALLEDLIEGLREAGLELDED